MLGDSKDPLLVSVRSGRLRVRCPLSLENPSQSRPPMIDPVESLCQKNEQSPVLAYDSYRRFIQMYSTTAMGLSKEPMGRHAASGEAYSWCQDGSGNSRRAIKRLCNRFQAFYQEKKGRTFPAGSVETALGRRHGSS